MAFLLQFAHCWQLWRGYPLAKRFNHAWRMTRWLRRPDEPFIDTGEYWP